MSLILEALKKSEANRRLGEAPDLATPFATKPRRRGPMPLLIVLIVLASAGGWWLLRTPSPAPGAPPAAANAMAGKPPAPAAPVAAKPKAPAPTPSVSATPSAQPQDQLAGGFADTPKPWALQDGATARRQAAAAAGAAPPAPVAAIRKDAVATAAPAVANPPKAVPPPAGVNAPAPPPDFVAASGTAQKKIEPAANAAPRPAPSVVEGGTGQKKAEPAPAAGSVVASGPGQKKAEPPTAAAGSVVAGGTGQKKPEPAAAQPAPGSVVAGGEGQRKSDKPADATPPLPPLSAPAYSELPFATRKDLPALKLSMHVYAAEPLQRFVILNNSRMVEGDKQDELSVREIRPDGIVLEFHGQRFFYPRDGS